MTDTHYLLALKNTFDQFEILEALRIFSNETTITLTIAEQDSDYEPYVVQDEIEDYGAFSNMYDACLCFITTVLAEATADKTQVIMEFWRQLSIQSRSLSR